MNADYQDFKYKELAAKLEVKRKAFDNLRKQSPARYASSGTRKRAGLWISARPPRPEPGRDREARRQSTRDCPT